MSLVQCSHVLLVVFSCVKQTRKKTTTIYHDTFVDRIIQTRKVKTHMKTPVGCVVFAM